MSLRVERRPRVRQDLVEIGAYIALDNPSAAERVVDAIEADIRELAERPGKGAECRFKVAGQLRGLRKWVVPEYRNYIIYYRPVEGGIEVVRVLHGARDQGKTLGREA